MKDQVQSADQNSTWQAWQVYVMAAICLLVGVLVGYLVRGSAPAAAVPMATAQPSPEGAATTQKQMPSLDDMKRMADKQAEPLLAK